MPSIGSIVVMTSVLKPHIFKFFLLLVVMLLGFNACVLFNGWPSPIPKYLNVVTDEKRTLISLQTFGQPSVVNTVVILTTFPVSTDHVPSTTIALSVPFTSSKNATPPTARTSMVEKATTKTALIPLVLPKSMRSSSRRGKEKMSAHLQEYYRQLTENKYHKKSSPTHLVDSGVIKKVLRPPRNKCSCREKMCLDCLHPDDVKFYNLCLRNTRKAYNVSAIEMEGKCHFIEGRNRAAVALVSYMGSGNTWVRELLEITTGLCTGAVYCDKSLRRAGMNGEQVHSGSVLVTKTHYLNNVVWTDPNRPMALYFPKMRNNRFHPAYSSAIFLIRNPFDAIISEFIRFSFTYQTNVNSHTVVLNNQSYFVNNTRWNQFVRTVAKQWRDYFPVWLVEPTNNGRPILVVKYEDLASNTTSEVKRMLHFLNLPCTEEELQQKLESNRYGIFRRVHTNDNFDHYTTDQRQLINQTISDALEYLRTNYTSTLGIEKYLWYG